MRQSDLLVHRIHAPAIPKVQLRRVHAGRVDAREHADALAAESSLRVLAAWGGKGALQNLDSADPIHWHTHRRLASNDPSRRSPVTIVSCTWAKASG